MPNQIPALIQIYKHYECLWNTNHIDFRFKNKRDEALIGMQYKIQLELNVKISLQNLKNEIQKLRKCFRDEKRWQIIKNRSFRPVEFEHYAEMSFLEAHIGPFKCKSCGEIMKTHDNYRVHVAGHEGNLPFKCSICNKGFMLLSNYISHLRRHSNNFPYKCDVCSEKFVTSLQLNMHKRGHIKQKQRTFKCTQCPAIFTLLHDLCKHTETNHYRPCFPCGLCSDIFYKRKQLTVHMKNVHLDD